MKTLNRTFEDIFSVLTELVILSVFVNLDMKVMVIIVIIKMSVDEQVMDATYLLNVMIHRDRLFVNVYRDSKEMVDFVTISTNVTRALTHVMSMASAKILWDHMHAVVWMAMKATEKLASILIPAAQILVIT